MSLNWNYFNKSAKFGIRFQQHNSTTAQPNQDNLYITCNCNYLIDARLMSQLY